MDIDSEDHDVIDMMALLLFISGDEFALENEVLHHVEEESEASTVWGHDNDNETMNERNKHQNMDPTSDEYECERADNKSYDVQ